MEWEHSLCGCCESNVGFCCSAACCPCCIYGANVSAWAKVRNRPDYAVLDATCCFILGILGGIGFCCSAKHRQNNREFSNIKGSFQDDLIKHCCCFCCAVTQEYEQARSILRKRRADQWNQQQQQQNQSEAAPPAYAEAPPSYGDYLKSSYGIGGGAAPYPPQ